MLDGHTLVLNRSWLAVHITPVRRALQLLYLGHARALHPLNFTIHDFDGWLSLSQKSLPGNYIRTTSLNVRLPEVIVLSFFNGFIRHEARFSREAVFERDDYMCQYCTPTCANYNRRLSRSQLSLDHVMPASRGGKDCWENLVVACHKANVKKGNRTPEEAGMRLRREPKKPQWTPQISGRLPREQHDLWSRFLDPAQWSLPEAK